MVTAIRRAITPSNKYSRTFHPVDMGSCELYLPLYQEDMRGTSLVSYDRNNHVCTRTGGVYDQLGWTADGDDQITAGSPAILDLRGVDYTMIVWTKPVTPTASYTSFFRDGNHNISFNITNSLPIRIDSWVNNSNSLTSSGTLVTTKFYHCALTHTVAGGRTLYIDAVASGTSGAVTQTTYTDMVIGIVYKGTIGEGWIYVGKAFSAAELSYHRQLTKWRYGV